MDGEKYRYCADAPLISVVIPVYNVEAYLRKCLESVAAQTLKNFEVIVINDGSPDGSQEIIDEFTARYENFRGIQISNHGIGRVRNIGAREAKGQYIAFFDSDDWVAPCFLEKLWDKAVETDADIACCNYYYVFPCGLKIKALSIGNRVLDGSRATHKLIDDMFVHHFAWNKLYKRRLFTEGGVCYPPILFEDIATTVRLFHQAARVAFMSEPLYFYYQRRGSIMHTITYRRLQEHINAYAMLRAYCDKAGCQREFARNLRFSRRIITLYLIGEIIQLNPEKRNQSMLRDMVNAIRQLRAFKNDRLPIKGEPWEELVTQMLYPDGEVPSYWNAYREEGKPYCSFFEDYDSKQKSQYAEV